MRYELRTPVTDIQFLMFQDRRIVCYVLVLQFYSLLENSAIANTTLQFRQVTLFAPTNLAFQKYQGSKDDLILYHMCKWQSYRFVTVSGNVTILLLLI